MEFEELTDLLGIYKKGNLGQDNESYVIDLNNSDEFGRIYTILENSDVVAQLEDNQVVTEEGSSLMYEFIDEPYIVNLLSDWAANQYQLVITKID